MSSTANTRSAGPMVVMWRLAEPADDDSLVEMCLQLYDEDPGVLPVRPENIRATLRALLSEPCRGRAVVLEIESQLSGYASEVLQRAGGDSLRAKRDYAMLAMLFGCGFGRSELVGLEWTRGALGLARAKSFERPD